MDPENVSYDSEGSIACFGSSGCPSTTAVAMSSRLGARTVTGVLATRGASGMAGRTNLLASGASSERFRAVDRRVYSPVCLTMAALSFPRNA
jgi:hypothetical protein